MCPYVKRLKKRVLTYDFSRVLRFSRVLNNIQNKTNTHHSPLAHPQPRPRLHSLTPLSATARSPRGAPPRYAARATRLNKTQFPTTTTRLPMRRRQFDRPPTPQHANEASHTHNTTRERADHRGPQSRDWRPARPCPCGPPMRTMENRSETRHANHVTHTGEHERNTSPEAKHVIGTKFK